MWEVFSTITGLTVALFVFESDARAYAQTRGMDYSRASLPSAQSIVIDIFS